MAPQAVDSKSSTGGESDIVLIPSLALGDASWAPLGRLITDRSCRTVDLPGHGGQRDLRFTLEAAVDLALDSLAPSDSVHLVGCGAGAMIAEEVARRRPVSSLTLISWPPADTGASMSERARAAEESLASDPQRFLAGYRKSLTSRATPPPLDLRPAAFAEALHAAARWRPRKEPPADLVTIVVGGADTRTSQEGAQALATLWGGAMRVIPDAGHVVYWDAPEALARLLTNKSHDAI